MGVQNNIFTVKITGKFSGTLEVNNLVGGNLCEVFVAKINMTTLGSKNDEVTLYTTTIHINPWY